MGSLDTKVRLPIIDSKWICYFLGPLQWQEVNSTRLSFISLQKGELQAMKIIPLNLI
jgi:hypothetical protein